jgi:hypothetical protein
VHLWIGCGDGCDRCPRRCQQTGSACSICRCGCVGCLCRTMQLNLYISSQMDDRKAKHGCLHHCISLEAVGRAMGRGLRARHERKNKPGDTPHFRPRHAVALIKNRATPLSCADRAASDNFGRARRRRAQERTPGVTAAQVECRSKYPTTLLALVKCAASYAAGLQAVARPFYTLLTLDQCCAVVASRGLAHERTDPGIKQTEK